MHVVMVRVGSKYGPEYVATLSDMLARNLSEREDVTPWIVTDDPSSVPEGVNVIPHNPDLPGWWQKVWLFSQDMPWAEGERIAYFDLDSAIVGRLEPLVEHKGIVKDWLWPCFNSSVMVWDHGEHRQIWDLFTPDVMTRPARIEAGLPKGQVNGGDQEWICEVAPDFPLLPLDWVVSYKVHAQDNPPDNARVVCFHGDPKPHQIQEGWVPQVWKVGGLTQLPRSNGVNVSQEQIRSNIRSALERPLPWFKPHPPKTDRAVLCCGGPSLANHMEDVRWHASHGAKVVSVNNAWRFLVDNRVTPDAHVMLDARPENAAFLDGCPQSTRYFVASQCDPAVFDALADRQVTVWHNAAPGLDDLWEPHFEKMALRPWECRPMFPVPGGGFVGLRALILLYLSGYRKIHVYGLDSSYSGSRHHAYPQALNDADGFVEVKIGPNGKTHRCARWMVRQAEEFKEAYEFLTSNGVSLHVKGDGLIPELARNMRQRLAA